MDLNHLSANVSRSREPDTPLRWSPKKRPVTVERDSLKRMNVLGSPVPLRSIPNNSNIPRVPKFKIGDETTERDENHPSQQASLSGSSQKNAWTLAPPPPLIPRMPKRPTITARVDAATCRAHADRLRARLRVAYFKVQTHQENLKLSELDTSVARTAPAKSTEA